MTNSDWFLPVFFLSAIAFVLGLGSLIGYLDLRNDQHDGET